MMQKSIFNKENEYLINWKAFVLLRHFVNRFGNIKKRKFTKLPVKYQKRVRKAIINAREFGLIPYIK
jgi:ribosomal protein S18